MSDTVSSYAAKTDTNKQIFQGKCVLISSESHTHVEKFKPGTAEKNLPSTTVDCSDPTNVADKSKGNLCVFRGNSQV